MQGLTHQRSAPHLRRQAGQEVLLVGVEAVRGLVAALADDLGGAALERAPLDGRRAPPQHIATAARLQRVHLRLRSEQVGCTDESGVRGVIQAAQVVDQ